MDFLLRNATIAFSGSTFFKVDVVFNMMMMLFAKYLGKTFQCWVPGCNHYCLFLSAFLILYKEFVTGFC